MIVGAPAQGPIGRLVSLMDRRIVDAGKAPMHQAVLIELPVLVAVGTESIAAVVVPLIGEAHGHAVFAEATLPLAGEETDEGLPRRTLCGSASSYRQQARPFRGLDCTIHLQPGELFDRRFQREGRHGRCRVIIGDLRYWQGERVGRRFRIQAEPGGHAAGGSPRRFLAQ
jgi:hypothetical protein